MAIRIDEYGHIIRDGGNQNNQNSQNNPTGTSSSGDRLSAMPSSARMESDPPAGDFSHAPLERPQNRKYWGIGIIALLAFILFRSCSGGSSKSSVEITTGDMAVEVGDTIQISIKSTANQVTANYDHSLIELAWSNTTQKNGSYYVYANVTGLSSGTTDLRIYLTENKDVYDVITITVAEVLSAATDPVQSDDEETSAQPKYVAIAIPNIEPNALSVDSIEQSRFLAESATIFEYGGSISFEEQSDSYIFEAVYDGRYRADISGMQSGTVVELYIYDSEGNKLASDTYCKSGEGVTATGLTAGNIYEVRVIQHSGYSDYSLAIGLQKQIVNISDLTELTDSIEYTDQRNVYMFTAPIDGRYRFELSGMMSGTVTELYAFNDLGETLASDTYCQNGEGVTLKGLEGGKTYEVQVRQHSGFSSYNLSIGLQKGTVDISGRTLLTDSVEYTDQRNVYTFTAPIDGRYRFELSRMMSGTVTELYVFNDLNETLASDTYCQNGEGITLKGLKGGKTYEVQVRQHSGFSSYNLSIGLQKETVDIENSYIITDSIEYTDQRNVYSFFASVSGDVTFTISRMESSTAVELYAFNDLEETVASDTYCQNNESITIKNVSVGTYYEIQVRQSSGIGDYTLTVD